jgi:hypothetical protein
VALFIHILVFLEKVRKLLVILKLLLLHGDNIIDMSFESSQVVTKNFLVFHKLHYTFIHCDEPCFTNGVRRLGERKFDHVVADDMAGGYSLKRFETLRDSSLWA